MRTDKEWRYWGKADPLWSVARWRGKDVKGKDPWKDDDFLALGASDFGDVLRHWKHYGLTPGRCVEIGCGAGRMTKQLAECFESVLALDVSQEQMDIAARLLGSSSWKVTFAVVDQPTIPGADASCDAMFSCHVFQHLPDLRAIRAYLQEARRVVRSGGTICFHLPVEGAHLASRQTVWWYRVHNAYTGVKRLLGARRISEYHRYASPIILRLLGGLGFVDAELRIFPMKANGDYHSYFFATVP